MSLYVRGDWHVCPNPLSLDTYNVCELDCRFCFVKQMERSWLKRKARGGLRPLGLRRLRNKLRMAFSWRGKDDDPVLAALRADLPVIVGRKCEPFCPSERTYEATRRALRLLSDYDVKVIVETRMVEGVYETATDYADGVNISILFGDEKVRELMEPGTPPYEERWRLARELKEAGLYVGIIAEPLIHTINDREEFYEEFARKAADAGVDHVNFGELRVSSVREADRGFRKAGISLMEVIRKKKVAWPSEGWKIMKVFKEYGIPVSSPDWVNFGFDNDREGCCGLDPFGVHHLTFQYALRVIKRRGEVKVSDVLRRNVFGKGFETRFLRLWRGDHSYYSLKDVEGVKVVGVDEKGLPIYGLEGMR